jgi:endonuclease/exonuclease/phosphatase family metal-dependent hydrolase
VDVPVELAPGVVIHVLASHPTPPAFDAPASNRNKARNHDEVRFWRYYLDGADFIVDDLGLEGGLDSTRHFVILGDLNADPDEGSSIGDPIGSYLLSHPRVNGSFVPRSDVEVEDLDPDDTAQFGLRVDYVLPSTSVRVVGGGVFRPSSERRSGPTDHYPVWLDLEVPSTGQ